MIMISHLFPGITPFNIWDLPFGVWLGYKAATDAYVEGMKDAKP